ncbi:MAG: PIN domain-containing protein [Deltaproteobacteria bacterium]|nr:PIN domain-containing protein [Deltaproteobacteria bacterium]
MPSIALYDACVLYPAPVRDLLLRIALTGLVQAKWTDRILDECFEAILRNRPDLSREKLARTRQAMNVAIADSLVTDYAELIGGLNLPDPGDNHVLAAAIKAEAQVIVTANTKHFPEQELAKHNIKAAHPDDFVYELLDIAPDKISNVVVEQTAVLKNPPYTEKQLLDRLYELGLKKSVHRLRTILGIE